MRASILAFGILVVACGARTPLAAEGDDASADGDDVGSSQDVATQDAPSTADVSAAADPCSGMPPMPCPGGGQSYCVNGHYSQCPQRCGICVPGSTRVCFQTYCSHWGLQVCASDGLSFGFCKEQGIPSKCAAAGAQYGSAPELEKCCIDNGYCCADHFDLNNDGNYDDQLGSCSGTSC